MNITYCGEDYEVELDVVWEQSFECKVEVSAATWILGSTEIRGDYKDSIEAAIADLLMRLDHFEKFGAEGFE